MSSSPSSSNLPDNDSLYDAALQGLVWHNFFVGCAKEWRVALCSRFVVYFAAGKPHRHTFSSFIAQNLHLLRAIANAYQVVEERFGKELVIPAELRETVLQEISYYEGPSCSECGLDFNRIRRTPAYASTVKYRDFLMAKTSGEIEGVADPGNTMLAAYIVGAITPYVRLFAFLCKEFKDLSGGAHLYQTWIDRFSEDGANKTEDLLYKLTESLSEEERRIIQMVYLQAMKLVVDFFVAQPVAYRTVIPLCKEHNPAQDLIGLCSDFDSTCTYVDSSEILKEIAIETASEAEQSQAGAQPAQMSSVELRNKCEELSNRYTKEYTEWINRFLSSEACIGFNEMRLVRALNCISGAEKRTIERVAKSHILKGLNIDDIKRGGERINLQDGCANFFLKVIGKENFNMQTLILSDCWCSEMARSAFSSAGLGAVHIHGNELVLDNSSSLSTGKIVEKVENLNEKLKLFSFSADCQRLSNKDKRVVTVYIGDGVSDLRCLLKADIGILIGSTSTSASNVTRFGGHFGVSFVPLFRFLVAKQKEIEDGGAPYWKGDEGVLYTVSGWKEIHAFILGTGFVDDVAHDSFLRRFARCLY